MPTHQEKFAMLQAAEVHCVKSRRYSFVAVAMAFVSLSALLLGIPSFTIEGDVFLVWALLVVCFGGLSVQNLLQTSKASRSDTLRFLRDFSDVPAAQHFLDNAHAADVPIRRYALQRMRKLLVAERNASS